jgi:hypothetical protein
VNHLAELVAGSHPAELVRENTGAPPSDAGHQNGHAERVADLATMSDAEVEALLLAKLSRR